MNRHIWTLLHPRPLNEDIFRAAFKLGELDLGPPSSQLETATKYKRTLFRIADEVSVFRLLARLRGRLKFWREVVAYWRTCRQICGLLHDFENSSHARFLRFLLEKEDEQREVIEIGAIDLGPLKPFYRLSESLGIDSKELAAYLRVNQLTLNAHEELDYRHEKIGPIKIGLVAVVYTASVTPIAAAILLCPEICWSAPAQGAWVFMTLAVGVWLICGEVQNLHTARRITHAVNSAKLSLVV